MCLSRLHKRGIGSRAAADENHCIMLHVTLCRFDMIKKKIRVVLSPADVLHIIRYVIIISLLYVLMDSFLASPTPVIKLHIICA